MDLLKMDEFLVNNNLTWEEAFINMKGMNMCRVCATLVFIIYFNETKIYCFVLKYPNNKFKLANYIVNEQNYKCFAKFGTIVLISFNTLF